jgi:hypothetical protein
VVQVGRSDGPPPPQGTYSLRRHDSPPPIGSHPPASQKHETQHDRSPQKNKNQERTSPIMSATMPPRARLGGVAVAESVAMLSCHAIG